MRALLFALACVMAVPAAAQSSIAELPASVRAARQAQDLELVARYRQGLTDALRYIRSHPQVFPAAASAAPRLLPMEEREAVRRMWQRVLDYYLALDAVRQHHADYANLDDKAERAASFRIAYAAFVAGYGHALELIAALRHTPGIDHLLNETVPELGMPASSYDRFKFRFLNVAAATEFAALEAFRMGLGKTGVVPDDSPAALDAAAIWRHGKGRGHVMTAANAVRVAHKVAHSAWFPVQAGVAEWMGDAKVYRPKQSLISPEQRAALPGKLLPGDVLLVRREWYLSNIGLPGFWPHAALYIGTADERRRYFDDAVVRDWVRAQGEASGEFERLLQSRYSQAYRQSITPHAHDEMPRVLEAISEGVSFTTISHAADADSLAALRPRQTKLEVAIALLRAFGYAGRPYDFDFDFRSDAALVCTELVYKAYEPGGGIVGLRLPLVDIMGRVATPANEIARQFDAQFGSAGQQTDLVLFFDGMEKKKQAVASTLEEFRRSWQRPKWHVLEQEPAAAAIAAASK